MNSEILHGRHRAPGRHNSLHELRLLARESAQPALKVGALVAATGGLVAAFASPASAATLSPASADAAAAAAPAAVGPATAPAAAAPTALSKIGYAQAAQQVAAQRSAKPAPQVIEDIQVRTARDAAAAQAAAARQAAARQAAARQAAARQAAARQAAAARASRDLTRTTLTTSTSSTKSSSNAAVPGASSGMRASHNWATPGQCTWGALSQWYQSEGYYPGGWTGNAMAWAYGARSAGYTVGSAPRTRSIIVMQPGVAGSSSVGHVGWVTAVNGSQVTILEMNATAGAYNYDTRTVTLSSGMQFIYAP